MPTELQREPELVAAERALVTGPSLLPAFRGPQMAEGLAAYRELQKALDQGMPEQLINISGRMFRKKGYWRALGTAFALSVACLKEESDEEGWRVVYRATSPSGRFADGDGTCTHAEKAERMDTEHNVRSHAHTRAFNRAVSNLVGFGEVSAEELRPERPAYATTPNTAPAAKLPPGTVRIARIDSAPTKNPKVLRYRVTLSTGDVVHTINSRLANEVEAAIQANVPVVVETKQTQYGTDLVSVKPYAPPSLPLEEGELSAEDIPF